MASKLIFVFFNSLAPGSGFYFYREDQYWLKYFAGFVGALLFLFYIPLLPVNFAFFLICLIYPIGFILSIILAFSLGAKLEVNKKKAFLVSLFCFSFSLVLFISGFRKGRIRLVQTISTSMRPTLNHGEIVLVEKSLYGKADLDRGDIVVFKHPQQDMQLIKRIVGLDFDQVKSTGLLIHSQSYKERLIKPLDGTAVLASNGVQPYKLNFEREVQPIEEISPVKIPADHFYALGDNRQRSVDSRAYGPVSRERLVGVVRYVIFSQKKRIFFGLPY